MREEKKTQGMIMIAIGNVVVILIALIAWFVIGKLRARKQAVPEMQLEMPKK
jgi:FlaG/FlaF family flagellin (archaellin)